MAHKTKERQHIIRNAQLLEEDNAALDEFGFPKAPYQADARTGHFGKGSKSSGFYYGAAVTVHTKPRGGGNKVLMMELSVAEFERKSQAGEDWQRNVIKERNAGKESERVGCFQLEEQQCEPLMRLVKEADEKIGRAHV